MRFEATIEERGSGHLLVTVSGTFTCANADFAFVDVTVTQTTDETSQSIRLRPR